MSPLDAAKIILAHMLYICATVKERDEGLYPCSYEMGEVDRAAKTLQDFPIFDEEHIGKDTTGAVVLGAKKMVAHWEL